MENQEQEYTRETLLTEIDTLSMQNDAFYERLVKRLLVSGRVVNFGNDMVYLPYFGNDEKVISRLFNTFIKVKYPGYTAGDSQSNLLKKLIRIFTGEAERPGVILQGPVGSGKTTLMFVWLEFRHLILGPSKVDRTNYNDFRRVTYPSFIFYSPSDIRYKFEREGFVFLENSGGSANTQDGGEIMFIDDFGVVAKARHYGEDINLLEEVVYRRYEEFKRATNFEFYATTNCTKKEIKEHFNARVFSRLSEMASWEVLTDSDHRLGSTSIIKQWPKLPTRTNSYFPRW